MTEHKYEIGLWHGWLGGKCPLPEGTKYRWRDADDVIFDTMLAADLQWNHAADRPGDNLISFCVEKYPPEPKRTGWVNVYSHYFKTRKEADDAAAAVSSSGRIACVQWTEGEGLE